MTMIPVTGKGAMTIKVEELFLLTSAFVARGKV